MTDAKVSTVTPHKQMPVKEMVFFSYLDKVSIEPVVVL